jgi:DNA-binding NtrC family response regulator
MANILVVDDELGIRALLSEILFDEGHSVELAENASQARSSRERSRPDLVLLDIWMPDVDGITLLKEWGAGGQLDMPVIMMSGHGTIDTAVEATKFGAMAFLEKPITLQKLLRAVEQGLARPAPKPPPVRPGSLAYAGSTGLGGGAMPGIANVAGIGLAGSLSGATGGTLAANAPFNGHVPHHVASTPVEPLGPQSEQLFELDRPLREARDAFEKCYFEFHLARENGSMTRVAEKTGLERTHLYRKLKQLGVDLSRNRRGAP